MFLQLLLPSTRTRTRTRTRTHISTCSFVFVSLNQSNSTYNHPFLVQQLINHSNTRTLGVQVEILIESKVFQDFGSGSPLKNDLKS